MSDDQRRTGLGKPIVLTGEEAEAFWSELENPTEPTKEQKQFFREVMSYAETEKVKETFAQALAYIENNTFSNEQREKLQTALRKNQ